MIVHCKVPGAGTRQRGQALIEVVVAMLLLLPLFVAVYLMWAWQDARHAALVAARYAAFDAALGDRGSSASALQRALQGHILDGRQRGWWSLDAGGSSLLDDPQVQVNVRQWTLPGSLAQVEGAAFASLAPALALGSGVLDLERGGGVRSAVTLPARAVLLPGALERVPGPRIAAGLSLLADPWRSGSPEIGRARVAALSASGRMRGWVEPLRGVRDALALIEPAFEQLCLGRIDVDVVPVDRLVGSTGGPADLRQRPCP